MTDGPERARVTELIELLGKYQSVSFGTVEICLPGRRFVCSFGDLLAAIRRIAADAATPWL
jgi:hypothetical protein